MPFDSWQIEVRFKLVLVTAWEEEETQIKSGFRTSWAASWRRFGCSNFCEEVVCLHFISSVWSSALSTDSFAHPLRDEAQTTTLSRIPKRLKRTRDWQEIFIYDPLQEISCIVRNDCSHTCTTLLAQILHLLYVDTYVARHSVYLYTHRDLGLSKSSLAYYSFYGCLCRCERTSFIEMKVLLLT